MGRAAEEHGEHPLFALERGEISEGEFRAGSSASSTDGFDLAAPARALLRAPRAKRADDRLRRASCAGAACARRCSRTTCASGSRSGAPSCPSSTRSSRWWWTRRSWACASPTRRSTSSRSSGSAAWPPSDCVFVDDLEVNCEAARALGMAAVRFENAEQAIAEIEAALRRLASADERGRASPRGALDAEALVRAQRSQAGPGATATRARPHARRAPRLLDRVELGAEDALRPRAPSAWRVVWSQPATTSTRARAAAPRGGPPSPARAGARAAPRRLDPLAERQADVDRLERRHDPLVLLHGDGLEERLAVGEVLEDRALGHAGALRDRARPWAAARPRRAARGERRRAPGACARRGPCGRRAVPWSAHSWRENIFSCRLFFATSGVV